MPVWHDSTRELVKAGKLILIGVIQEQHPERGRLFAQWKGFDWPILHDPINVLETSAVPVAVAIDEHGIVRSIRPKPPTIAVDFVDQTFADDPAAKATPPRYGPTHPVAFAGLKPGTRAAGDALALWDGNEQGLRELNC